MTPWVRNLLFANVAMFFATLVLPQLSRELALIPALVIQRPWTPLTYMFVHAGLWHLAFNMLGLFFFGPRLEERLGSQGFLWLYLISGLTGALLSLFTPAAAIVGASGAIFGVLLGFARYWPREQIYIWGILPIEARWLVAIMTALALFGGFGGGQSGTAHFAHLGGFVGGALYLYLHERRSPARAFRKKATAPPTPGGAGGGGWQPTRWQPAAAPDSSSNDLARWRSIPRTGMHSLNSEELDRILDKISASGITSLTPDERAYLERMSARQ